MTVHLNSSSACTCTQQGITLIELVMSMVIIAIALTGVLTVMNTTVRHSADPLLLSQSIAIAESYLEEILLQQYSDPSPVASVEASRNLFDNVADYDGLSDAGAHDQLGNPITGLESFNVSVSVVSTTISGMNAWQTTVTVAKAGIDNISLVGYRFDY